MAVDPKGRVFVTDAIGDEIAVSTDGGATFVHQPVPSAPPGALELLGDAIVQVDPRGHLVYTQLFATAIQVAVSFDGARSWASNTVIGTSGATYAPWPDRQWVGFGPKSAVYAIWRMGETYWTASSSDGGRTFGLPQPFLPGTDIFSNGPPVADASGRVYVPLIHGIVGNQSIDVAVSPPGENLSFVVHQVTTATNADFFPIGAVDSSGNVSVTWREGSSPGGTAQVSRSTNHGVSWSQPHAWSGGSTGVDSSPWINTRGAQTDVLWYNCAKRFSSGVLMLTRGASDGSGLKQAQVARVNSAYTDYAHFTHFPDGRVIAVWTDSGDVYMSVELPPGG